MWNTEVAPKHKNFLRTSPLNWRIQNMIGVHNAGYMKFYSNIMKYLNIVSNKQMTVWLNNKDNSKVFKTFWRDMLINKRKRVYKCDHKYKEELMRDRMKDPKIGTYRSGIGVHEKPPKKKKITVRKQCYCGNGKTRYNKSYSMCLRNAKFCLPTNVTPCVKI